MDRKEDIRKKMTLCTKNILTEGSFHSKKGTRKARKEYTHAIGVCPVINAMVKLKKNVFAVNALRNKFLDHKESRSEKSK